MTQQIHSLGIYPIGHIHSHQKSHTRMFTVALFITNLATIMAIIRKTDNDKYWRECGRTWNLHTLLVGMKNYTANLENSLSIS